MANGAHTLTARARDASDNTTAKSVNVTVNNAAQIPVTIAAITVDTHPSAVPSAATAPTCTGVT